jgi:urease accessory protein
MAATPLVCAGAPPRGRVAPPMPRDDAIRPAAPHQRADGALDLAFAAVPGRGTALARLYQAAPLRALFPAPEADEAPIAALVNTAGGLAGGDSLRIAARVDGAGALATLSTAAAEKIYRSLGPETRIAAALEIGPGAALEWIPQETILFDSARLERRMRASLAPGARLLAAETLVFGRAARGERLCAGMLFDSWRLLRDGAPLWADALRLEGDLAAALDAPFGFGGAEAMATLVFAGEGVAEPLLTPLRDCAAASPAPGAATLPRPGLLLARWLGGAAAVRAAVAAAILALRPAALGQPARLPRL